jgi:hypothetical protein
MRMRRCECDGSNGAVCSPPTLSSRVRLAALSLWRQSHNSHTGGVGSLSSDLRVKSGVNSRCKHCSEYCSVALFINHHCLSIIIVMNLIHQSKKINSEKPFKITLRISNLRGPSCLRFPFGIFLVEPLAHVFGPSGSLITLRKRYYVVPIDKSIC